jgi:hypothetical protein
MSEVQVYLTRGSLATLAWLPEGLAVSGGSVVLKSSAGFNETWQVTAVGVRRDEREARAAQ